LPDPMERRAYPRTKVSWPLTIDTGNTLITGETVDVSVEGLSICCDEPLVLNDTYVLEIVLPGDLVIKVNGQVVWSDLCGMDRDKVVCMGVCIAAISDKDRQLIEDIVNARMDD